MARTGAEYIEALRMRPPNLWYKGEKVEDPTTHPVFRGIVRAMAALYDLQHDPRYREALTYEEGGKRHGMSFLIPKTKEDLRRRGRAYKLWADQHLGMMGRSPDYLNAVVMAYAASADYFGEFADNVRQYYAYLRDHDLATTHALTNPQVNRAKPPSAQPDPYIPVGVVRQTEAGIVVRGARMTATFPLADEVLIFPSTLLQAGSEKYALAFALPTSTPGLHFVCREGLVGGDSPFDHPLSSRLEEMDCLVVFDDVLVPWERVFILGNVELCNHAYAATGALNHMAHQVVALKTAKTEAFLGVASLMAEGIGADAYGHVQEKIAEIIVYLEAMRAFWTRAEEEARENAYGLLVPDRGALDGARNLYPRLYPRLREILQQIGASGLITLPSERGLQGAPRPPSGEVPAGGDPRGQRAGGPLPPGLGHDPLRLRGPAGALRALLLRRPGAHVPDPLRRLRQGALQGPGQGLPQGLFGGLCGGGGVKEAFKEAMSRFAAGVTVVSARHGEERGMTATAFMSLSLEPPLVALGIAKKARLFPLLEASGAFAVSLLREGQEAIAEHFAGKPQEGVALVEGAIPGALAVLRCRLEAIYPAGDHGLVVGRVEAVELGEPGPPLVYFARGYRRFVWPS
jgi:4-hydroxyphenylacetate 3-monooxygenase